MARKARGRRQRVAFSVFARPSRSAAAAGARVDLDLGDAELLLQVRRELKAESSTRARFLVVAWFLALVVVDACGGAGARQCLPMDLSV